MAEFRIHRLRPAQRQQFRWAPHTSGTSGVKPKDYQPDGSVEAASPYGAWAALRGTAQPLEVGDLLESSDGKLYLCKYVGFEEARWVLPGEQPEGAAPQADGSQPTAPQS